jgi:hypothetical protein
MVSGPVIYALIKAMCVQNHEHKSYRSGEQLAAYRI